MFNVDRMYVLHIELETMNLKQKNIPNFLMYKKIRYTCTCLQVNY